MGAGGMVVKIAGYTLLGCALVGGPLVLAVWVQRRRLVVIARQIALTDALDAHFGVLVAPVVRKPLFGPWEVRMDLPLLGSAVLAGILAVTDAVFADVKRIPPKRYRIILRVTPTSWNTAPDRLVTRSAEGWTGTSVAAA